MKLKNKNIICEILGLGQDSQLNHNSLISDHGWDSLSAVMLLTFFSDEHDKEIDPDLLEEIETIDDLDKFISKNVEN
tara:strand:- start:1187 stop:1417 length:231 start_codon:yes stop_codon:yes gene_type:complete